MQTDDILILADNNFASIKEDVINLAKIMTKDREYLISSHLLKFFSIQIKLNLNGIVFTKKSHIGEIFSVTDHVVNSTNSRGII